MVSPLESPKAPGNASTSSRSDVTVIQTLARNGPLAKRATEKKVSEWLEDVHGTGSRYLVVAPGNLSTPSPTCRLARNMPGYDSGMT